MTKNIFKISIALLSFIIMGERLHSQTEAEPWGNITGIRIDGQLMEFESNISLVQKDWSRITATAKEKQRPKYHRKGNVQIINSNLDSLYFTETVTDSAKGIAHVALDMKSKADMTVQGVYYSFMLPGEIFAGGSIKMDNKKTVAFSDSNELTTYLQPAASYIQLISKKEQLRIHFETPVTIFLKSKQDKDKKIIQVFIPLQTGALTNGQTIATAFSIEASGIIEKKPVQLALNTKTTGRPFDGLGGNFRLQNPSVDPQVIDYCLKNLQIVWGRVEMPWRFWQPSIDTSGIDAAQSGRLNIRVQKSMEMAQRLYKMGMPVILTAWFPPGWAIVGPPNFRPTPNGVWGNPLDHSKDEQIYKSIADYIVYLKNQYNTEITDFSFNESDLGINIRQTGEEHAALIKGLGAYFVSRGLKTKLLLGDNSDANSFMFIDPAINDPATLPYIGAVSFHSWRGWDSTTLQKWADAATKLHLPLLIGEGSIDAAAWAYPDIFEEQTYALKEINLYTRLLAICQPASILQWQLTSDYSPVAGGGVYGDTGPLRPTQRFWNLKQLASVPKDLKAMPIKSSAADVSCAALGDNEKNMYSIQLVNNSTARQVALTGLPAKLKALRMFVTDKKRAMEEEKQIPVVNGKANFILEATSYTTLQTN
ncbi:MAG TPA: hypothetical protein VKI61_11270 [Chitinophagaceae bacterium]|jgi:hypothetical protein|nr:hypothetical protein [Chitinophagaceae bacterium]